MGRFLAFPLMFVLAGGMISALGPPAAQAGEPVWTHRFLSPRPGHAFEPRLSEQWLRADCTPQWLPGQGLPGVDGVVDAVTTWDPDGAGPQPELLVIGGYFTIAGDLFANNIAAWNGSAWQPLGSGMSGGTYPIVSDLTVHNGELIAGGSFTTAGGVPANRIARWNGSAWQPLGSGMNSSVGALTVYNGELIAGGSFTTAGGVSCNYIARWSGSAWQALGSGMSVDYSPSVCDLTVYNGELIAGGSFLFAGGVWANRIARWNGSTWQPLGWGMNNSVQALTVHNGELIAGGVFTTAGGMPANYIARWDGSAWQVLGSGMNTGVGALMVYNGELIAGGYFTTAGGVTCNHIARWNGSAWQPLGSGMNSRVFALTVYNGELIAGGSFASAGGAGYNGIARWDGTQWRPLVPGSGMESSVSALTVYNGELIAGGYFTTAGGVLANSIARWNGSAWQPLGSGMGGEYQGVFALMVCNGELIAGGGFTTAGGVPANRIARWNGSAWQPLGSGMSGGTYPIVSDLTVYNGELIAGGYFTTAGGVTCNYIARWNGSAWQPLGSGMSYNVMALAVYNGELIAGGGFTTAGGVSANYIARWNGSAWQPLGSGMSYDVKALAVYNGELIAGGGFTTAGGVLAKAIARWNGSAWQPLGSGMNSSMPALTVYNGELIAGGGFTTAGGVSANYIARWNGSAWQPLGSGMNYSVYAVTVYNGELIAGGGFTTAGGLVSAHWARWRLSCAGPGGVVILPGQSYDASDGTLHLAARVRDTFYGPVTAGTFTWSLRDPGGTEISNGTSAYDAGVGEWRATQTIGGGLTPGPYTVNYAIVTDRGRTGSAVGNLTVPGAVGQLEGFIRDEFQYGISGATVRLYTSTGFHDAGGGFPVDTTTTRPDGAYTFDEVQPGYYVVAAEAAGFVGQHAAVFVAPNTVSQRDLILSPGQTLAQLRTPMYDLYLAVLGAMNYETGRMSDITGQAAPHFNGALDAWDLVRSVDMFLGFAVGFGSMTEDALRWVDEQASWETVNRILVALVWQPVAGADLQVGSQFAINTTRAILPDGINEWRHYELSELIAQEAYTEGLYSLQTADAQFHETAGLLALDPAFDLDKARQMVAAQQVLLDRIAAGELVTALALPELDDTTQGFRGALLPLGRQVWLLEHVIMSVLGGARNILTAIKIGADTAFVASLIVGPEGPPLAGAISAGSGIAGLGVAVFTAPIRWLAAQTYSQVLEGWCHDMLTLPASYSSTRSVLEAEATVPNYLLAGRTFSGAVTINLNADLPGHFIYTLPLLPLAVKTAEVDIINTGNTTAPFRVVATGWWDYRLPGDWPLLGQVFGGVTMIKVPVSASVALGLPSVELAPGEPHTFEVPYLGIFADPLNAFSPHWLQVDVYSGPFLVQTVSEPYFVMPTSFPLRETSTKRDGGVLMTLLRKGQTEVVDRDNFPDLAPVPTLLMDAMVAPAGPTLDVPFSVSADAWSVSFQLSSDGTGQVALRVYDTAGRCVGYDSAGGGVRMEFPATFSGAGSARQVVEIPNAGGQSYTVLAALEGATSGAPVKVQVWALETPARPAVLAVAPAQSHRQVYRREAFTLTMTIGEAGGQVPLAGVTVTAGPILGPDGVTALTLTPPSDYDLGSIAAGQSQEVAFSMSVPQSAPVGLYSGTVTVTSSNAGTQIIAVKAEVLQTGDSDADGDLDLLDFAHLQRCFSGAGPVELAPGCGLLFDFEPDEDVDLDDYAVFASAFGESSTLSRLLESTPADQESLWRSANNVIRLTFDADITVPAPGEVRIEELGTNGAFGPDLSTDFTFTVEDVDLGGGELRPRVLRIQENGSELTHRTWIGIRNTGGPSGWTGVENFEVQYVVQVGDVNNDGKVLASDLSSIFPKIPTANAGDQERADVNGDGKVLASDLSAVFPHIPSATVPKPSGH